MQYVISFLAEINKSSMNVERQSMNSQLMYLGGDGSHTGTILTKIYHAKESIIRVIETGRDRKYSNVCLEVFTLEIMLHDIYQPSHPCH